MNNSLAEYITPNIGDYMKYDTAAGRKASLVDFLKIYFTDEKGKGEDGIIEDNEVRSSNREENDKYNNYIRNYNNNFSKSKDRRAPNTITLADLLPKRQNM